MKSGIRTPAEVIGLPLEEYGMNPETVEALSAEIVSRLSVAVRSVSRMKDEVVIHSPRKGKLSWGTVQADGVSSIRAWMSPEAIVRRFGATRGDGR